MSTQSDLYLTPHDRLRKLATEWDANTLVPVRVDDLRALLERPVSDLLLLALYHTARGWTGTDDEFLDAARGLVVGRIEGVT